MEIAITIFYILLFIFIIVKFRFFKLDQISSRSLSLAFIAKIGCGILLGFVYTYYYPDRTNADVFKYFDDSKIMYDALHKHPFDFLQMIFGIYNDNKHFHQYYNEMHNWYRQYESNVYNDSHTIIRFNAVIRIFSFGYFHVHTVFMSFISFIGLVAIYKSFITYIPKFSKLFFVAVFLIPSVIFWGSGVLKEGLLFFGLGITIYNLLKINDGNFRYYNLLILIPAFLLLIFLKFYILVAFIPSIFLFLLIQKTKSKKLILTITLFIISLLLSFELFTFIYPEHNPLFLLSRKQHDFIGLAKAMKSTSIINLNKLEPNLWSVFTNIPNALFNSFIRPTIFESTSILKLVSALENIAILAFGTLCLFCIKDKNKINYPLVLFSISFVLLLYLIIGLVTPVSGAIVRYKVPGIPFLLLFFLLLADDEKIILFYLNLKTKLGFK